jgi:hypothetical protein
MKAIAHSLASTLLNFAPRFDRHLGPKWVNCLGYDQMVSTSSSASQRYWLLIIAFPLSPEEQHLPFQIDCSFIHLAPILLLNIT